MHTGSLKYKERLEHSLCLGLVPRPRPRAGATGERGGPCPRAPAIPLRPRRLSAAFPRRHSAAFLRPPFCGLFRASPARRGKPALCWYRPCCVSGQGQSPGPARLRADWARNTTCRPSTLNPKPTYPIQSSPRACCAVDGNYLKSPHAHRSNKSLLRIRPIFRLPTVHEAQCLHVNGCESWNVNVSFFLLLPSATPCQQRARRASLATGRPSGPQNNPRTVE